MKRYRQILHWRYLLRNRMQFVNNKAFLCRLSELLTDHEGNDMMSRRERSFSIFGEEKELDNHLKLLEVIGITGDTLRYYETPEQCFSDYIPVRKPKMTLLICENKDIWFNIRRLMYEAEAKTLFDTQIDGVIFGQGNDITGKDKFRSYAAYLGLIQFVSCTAATWTEPALTSFCGFAKRQKNCILNYSFLHTGRG